MPTINNVRQFVINALKQYHKQQLTVEEEVVNRIVSSELANYVKKEAGKGLSEANFTATEKTKLEGIESGAQKNVQSDWNAASGDAQILNKPSLNGYFDYANYANEQIVFKNGGANGTTLFTINCADFLVDGMVENVSIEQYSAADQATNGTSYLFVDFNTSSGKTDIKIPLKDIFNPDNYYNKTEVDGLLGNKVDKVEGKGLSEADFTSTEKTKLAGIAEGAQVNVIESVKVNGTAQTVTAKAVDITVPTKTSDLTNDSNFVSDANYVHTDNNYTTTEKTKLSGIAEGAQVNVIEEVQLNGEALQVTNKSVNVVIPAAATVGFSGSKSVDDGDYTYVANGFSASNHQITVSYTGVLKSHQDISGKEDNSNKKTSLSNAANISDTYYPTTSAVTTYIGSIAELSTDELNSIFA